MICGIYNKEELISIINSKLNESLYILDTIKDKEIKKKLEIHIMYEYPTDIYSGARINILMSVLSENKYLVYTDDDGYLPKGFFDVDCFSELVDKINNVIEKIIKENKSIIRKIKPSKESQAITSIICETKLIPLDIQEKDESRKYIATQSFVAFNAFSDNEFDIEDSGGIHYLSRITDNVNDKSALSVLTKEEIISEIKNKNFPLSEGKELFLITKGYL